MAQFAQELTFLVWEVRQVFPEGRTKVRSAVADWAKGQEEVGEVSSPVGCG